MSESDLARVLQINQGNLSAIINGVRRPLKSELRIAAFFGKEREELFPPRSIADLVAMAEREQAERDGKGGAA
jgi:plasmid maintenance system antidote protein VapI